MKIKHACGSVLNITSKMAGQSVKCPHCGETFTAPAGKGKKKKQRQAPQRSPASTRKKAPARKSSRANACPKCDAPMYRGDVMCMKCGYNQQTRSIVYTDTTSGAAPSNVVLPQTMGAPGSHAPGVMIKPQLRGKSGPREALKNIYYRVKPIVTLVAVVLVGWLGWKLFFATTTRFKIENRLLDGKISEAISMYREMIKHGAERKEDRYKLKQLMESTKSKGVKELEGVKFEVTGAVWGRGQLERDIQSAVWVRFRLVNVSAGELRVRHEHFMVIGRNEGRRWAYTKHFKDADRKTALLLKPGQGIEAALYFRTMIERPTFLEYNVGDRLARAAVTRSDALVDHIVNPKRGTREDWPESDSLLEFPVDTPLRKCLLSPKKVAQYLAPNLTPEP